MGKDSLYVRWEHVLDVDFIRETPEVNGPRGWGEGAITGVTVRKETEGLLLTIEGTKYLVPNEVVEALYDMHQEIPR